MPADSSPPGNLWLTFALLTVATWGLYGLLLHTGQVAMGDPVHGRYKAFLWVGIAYFAIAIVGPLVMLQGSGAGWAMPTRGIAWSLLAGSSGAIGAFCVLLAFGAKGHPAAVMSIIFAGAPIVNALVAMLVHPPAGGFSSLRWQFVAGILLAALGGTLVTLYKPGPPPPRSAEAPR
jgi:drug/metabolite transporter (DMT)-like permease